MISIKNIIKSTFNTGILVYIIKSSFDLIYLILIANNFSFFEQFFDFVIFFIKKFNILHIQIILITQNLVNNYKNY